jgi:hypothetical protein
LSAKWIQSSKKILNRIRELEETKKKDRLEHVRNIRFMLNALSRSLAGWIQWVNNPNVMTKFTEKELEAISKELSKLTQSFIEYDLKTTKLGEEKGLTARKKAENKRRQGRGIYI